MFSTLSFFAAVALTCGFAVSQTFKSGVDLVRFDVRIVDEAGRPITDLRPEEVIVEESGRALPVVLFQRVSEPAESYVDAALRAVTAQVSSNDGAPRGHLYILVFDQQHITAGNEQRARTAAEQFIRNRVGPSDRVALFAIPGPGPQIGFTADRQRVIARLSDIRGTYERMIASPLGTLSAYEAQRITQGDERLIADISARAAGSAGSDIAIGAPDSSAGGRRAPVGEDPALTRRILLENARTVVAQTDSVSREFLQRLADVVAGFKDVEGRKTLVLFSEGFFQENVSRELETVAAAAAQSYVVFYSFDVNQRGIPFNEAEASATTLADETHARIAPLATLAAETAGMMIVDGGARAEQALDRIAEQAQDYYLVGFAPSAAATLNRGKYQRVSVKVTRPGARVSARTGYVLGKAVAAPADRQRALDNVLSAPFVQQGLKIDYTTYILKDTDSGRQRVLLSVAADLPVRSVSSDAADVVFVVRDVRDGRIVATGTDLIPLPGAPRPGSAVGTGAWRVQFSVPPGSYLMRTVVREPGGLSGSADRRLDVRALDGPDVTVSDMVITSAIGGLPVRPRAYAGDGLTALVEVYARAAAQLDTLDVRMDLRRGSDNATVASIQADLRDTEPEGGGVRRRAQLLMPLAAVPPGDYIARAVVRAGGEVVGERTRQLEVLPGSAPPADATAGAGTWTPMEIIQGDLARKYVTWISERAKGTPLSAAAQLGAANRWEEVALEVERAPATGSGATQGPASLPVHALRGLAMFVREDYAAAAGALKLARDAAPESALTAFFHGWAADGAGDARGALGAWRSAAHLDPSLVSAHLALADGYLRLAEPALAVQALRAGLAHLPSSPELLARLRQIEPR